MEFFEVRDDVYVGEEGEEELEELGQEVLLFVPV